MDYIVPITTLFYTYLQLYMYNMRNINKGKGYSYD